MSKEQKSCSCGEHTEHHNCTEDCGCGGHHGDETVDVLLLTMEDGSEIECYVLGVFDVEDKDYMVLMQKDDDELLVYQYIQNDDGLELLTVDDEEILEKIAQAFKDNS